MRKKSLFLALLLIAITATMFWGGSRYPKLNEKAMMGGDTGIDGIGFDTLIRLQPDSNFILRVLATTVNWIYSNLQGMTFGIIFGALLMILVTLVYRQYVQQGLPKVLLGGIMGIPLGVCVNCATPIAQGVYASGMHSETALSLMFSSPTLNVIVLSMMFSLMPFHIAVVKVGFTLLFILGVLPLLMRFLGEKDKAPLSMELLEKVNEHQTTFEKNSGLEEQAACSIAPDNDADLAKAVYSVALPENETWLNAAQWVVVSFFRNLWFICRNSLPLMLLAGFLGALVITIVPFDTIVNVLPTGNLFYIVVGMIALASVSLFLPVPMSFDIIVTVILIASGFPVYYAATMLFALGIFSVYPFTVVAKNMSKGIAIAVSASLIVLSLGAGALSYQWEWWSFTQQEKQVLQVFQESDSVPYGAYTSASNQQEWFSDGELVDSLQQNALKFESVALAETGDATVSRLPFRQNSQSADAGDWSFQAALGPEMGIDQHDNFSALKVFPFPPFMYSRGVASGDVHNDGWDDIVVASDAGVNLYANQQGEGYIEQQLHFPNLREHQVAVVALTDINDDGWLDLYFTTHRKGNFVIYNQAGRFLDDQIASVPNIEEAVVTTAASFGDIDKDGDLELVQGNWSQAAKDVHHDLSASHNLLLAQENGQFIPQDLPGEDGETNSLLFTDFNNDSNLDLLVGNDFYESDYYYQGDGDGNLSAIMKDDNIIPMSTTWTMSFATGDIDNDLTPEIYVAQISEAPESQTMLTNGNAKPEDICVDYPSSSLFYQRCLEYTNVRNVSQEAFQKRNVFLCDQLGGKEAREACIGSFVAMESTRLEGRTRNLCDYFPEGWSDLAALCNNTLQDVRSTDKRSEVKAFMEPEGEDIPIPSDRQFQFPPMDNLLLAQGATGEFENQTEQFKLELGGWSWNAKFADLNNDEWQDLYIANGAFQFGQSKTSNLLYVNQAGETFEDGTSEHGLQAWQDTVSYTCTDYDLDGDLDLVVVPSVGPVMVYQNTGSTNRSIAFALKDEKGNSFGIGSKVVIHYGEDRKQVREIQAGGGFASFDAPMAHFGLGDYDQVQQVDVHWSTGETTTLTGNFAAGYRYLIERPNAKSA